MYKILLGYGTWTQYSLFECFLTDAWDCIKTGKSIAWTQYSLFECFLTRKQLVLLRSKLAEHLLAEQDSVRFYPLCASCLDKVETVGGSVPGEAQVFVF